MKIYRLVMTKDEKDTLLMYVRILLEAIRSSDKYTYLKERHYDILLAIMTRLIQCKGEDIK